MEYKIKKELYLLIKIIIILGILLILLHDGLYFVIDSYFKPIATYNENQIKFNNAVLAPQMIVLEITVSTIFLSLAFFSLIFLIWCIKILRLLIITKKINLNFIKFKINLKNLNYKYILYAIVILIILVLYGNYEQKTKELKNIISRNEDIILSFENRINSCENKKNEYQKALKEANKNIERANSIIEDAQSYAWESCDEMGYVLYNLETVDTVDEPY